MHGDPLPDLPVRGWAPPVVVSANCRYGYSSAVPSVQDASQRRLAAGDYPSSASRVLCGAETSL